jgi:hypothetical protein
METTQSVCISLSSTEHVSFFEWKGKVRFQVTEARGRTAEISEIDLDELLRSISYMIRRIVDDADRTETQTRLLQELQTRLQALEAAAA